MPNQGTGDRTNEAVSAVLQPSVGAVFGEMLRHPGHHFVAQWNWKSALTSALMRGVLFFATNVTAGFRAASWALLLQFAFRATTSGFWGAFIQAMRHAQPRWLAGLVVGVGLSAVVHGLELLVHWLGRTPELKRSVAVSIAFTVVSSLFNLYIMQRNALLVGEHAQSLAKDMAAMPRLIAGFLAWPFTLLYRAFRPAEAPSSGGEGL
ncbi:MAG: hypothetical protein KJZ70_15920 [Bryobacterales bacterium]|nr:hypothetical protein [Bryobacterales bacterium]